jgi:spore maturation protein CgeB
MIGHLPPRRAVMATEFWYGSSGRALAEGLRQCGWDLAEVDLVRHLPQSRVYAARIASRVLRKTYESSYNKAILQEAADVDAEIFVAVKGSFLLPETLERLGEAGVKRVLHYPDVHFDHDGFHKDTLIRYDLIVTTKRHQVPFLSELIGTERVMFQHHGFDPLVHRPRHARVDEKDYLCDVGYLGNYSAAKAGWLVALTRAEPKLSIRIVGNDWAKAPAELHPYILGRPLMGDFASRFHEKSRISVAVHWGKVGKEDWEDQVSTRTFQIPACRCFMLHIDNEEVRQLYDVGSEIDVFSTTDEFVQKVRHYLANPALRAAMSERAYARARSEHSYYHRAQALSVAVERLLG